MGLLGADGFECWGKQLQLAAASSGLGCFRLVCGLSLGPGYQGIASDPVHISSLQRDQFTCAQPAPEGKLHEISGLAFRWRRFAASAGYRLEPPSEEFTSEMTIPLRLGTVGDCG